MKALPANFSPTLTLLNCDELRTALNVSKAFISSMRHCGFPMPGNRATAADAHAWLKANPGFAATKRRIETAAPSGNPLAGVGIG